MLNPTCDNGAISDSGAVTWVSAQYGFPTGVVNAANSIVGNVQTEGFYMAVAFDPVNQQLAITRPLENVVTILQPSLNLTYLPLTTR